MSKIVPFQLKSDFAEGSVNAFLVMGEKNTLIDTGNPGLDNFKQLEEQIQRQGLSWNEIDQIILTHLHIDHIGGVSHIQEKKTIPIFVHEYARASIEDGYNEYKRETIFFEEYLAMSGAGEKVDINREYVELNWSGVSYLTDGDVIQVGDHPYQVMHVPGHSQTDIVIWNEKVKVAFVGDHLLKPFSVNAFIEPPRGGEGERPKPLLQYRNSLQRVKQLPLRFLYSGHGEVINDHITLIEKRLAEHDQRAKRIINFLKDGEKTTFDLCQLMYPHLKKGAMHLGLSQIRGHLDYLLEQGQVIEENKDDIFYFRI